MVWKIVPKRPGSWRMSLSKEGPGGTSARSVRSSAPPSSARLLFAGGSPLRNAPAARGLGVALPLILILLLAPLAATPYLPLMDAPSHQARLAVLHGLLVTGEGSAFYRLDTLFLPNMGFDLIGLLLASWFGPGPAGWLFFAAML